MADASLVVAICSATFTGGGLAAQYLLYRFNGARLKVQQVFCYRTQLGATMSRIGPRRKLNWEHWRKGHNIDLQIEYAKVRVTNIGRTPVSVEDISLDFGHQRWFRRSRISQVPMQFVDPNDTSAKKLDLSPQRLDPGDNITVCYHLWPALGDPAHSVPKPCPVGTAGA